ncbi:MAG: gamma-glutamyltransferase [Nitrospinota bacterium]|nr:gamma-glutamyltransferase [Nitrospinota bacterium]
MSEKRHTILDTETLDPSSHRIAKPQRFSVSRLGMVSTAHSKATEAGVEMLEEGGNAIDAAVAAAFALGVCEPYASGLGGQTMMTLYIADLRKTIALDGSSRAPNRIVPGVFQKKELLTGRRASTVPSTPAVLDYTLRRFGTKKISSALGPAIRLAENGFEVSELNNQLTRRELKKLKNGSAANLFLKKGVSPYPVGSIFKQPVLAETMRRLAKSGVKDFYRGKIAKAIHEDMEANGGLIRQDDLAQIPHPIERKPISGRFEEWRILSFPPPGAGRVLVEMLNIFKSLPARFHDLDTPEGALAIAKVIQQANIDRQDRPRDPNFFPQVQNSRMLSLDYAGKVGKRITAEIEGRGETTHLSVMDRFGNVVALTQSIERVYGSCAAAPELGFLYNNYMSAFEHEDINHPYYLRPNAVPWASVAPTIVFVGRKPWAAIGSPGSERITSSILQTLLRLRKHSPLEAVSAPRLHCSIDGKVSLEGTRMRDDIMSILEGNGYQIDVRDPYSFYLGCVQMVCRQGKEFVGVADPRRDGSAKGPRI